MRSMRGVASAAASVVLVLALTPGAACLRAAGAEACLMCHAVQGFKTERAGRTVSLYVDPVLFAASSHRGLGCNDCHRDAAVKQFPHTGPAAPVNCGTCHAKQETAFLGGIHGEALKKGAPYAPSCKDCHGNHAILPPSDLRSATYKMRIPGLCGSCHREGAPVARVYDIPEKDILTNYSESIHGEALFKKGLIVTATCNNCHDNHKILPHTAPESTISAQNIARTCTQCHARIEEVHLKIIKGTLWEAQPGAIPACSDCHRAHKLREANLVQGASDRECLGCHEKPDVHKVVGGASVPLTVVKAGIQASVHRDTPCVKCHSDVDPARARPCETAGRVDCSNCHAKVSTEYLESDHGVAWLAKDKDAPYCTDCHGTHLVGSPKDEADRTYRANVPRLCGDCHGRLAAGNKSQHPQGNVLADYSSSVHGQSLVKKGLLPVAVCTDCHNKHLIHKPADPRSSVHFKNVPATCSTCHKGIYREFVSSVHSPLRGETGKKLPTCEDCHSAHKIRDITQGQFMTEVLGQCGSCHQDLAATYTQTIHGKAYTLGHLRAAKCSDCHGAHGIKAVDDPASTVGFANVVQTCQKCHPDANQRFTGYLTHATHHDRQKYPILFFTFWAMTSLLVGTFGFFGLHTLLWLPRSFQYMKEKRAEAHGAMSRYYVQRFTDGQRLTHVVVILSFMGLALSGMMLKFADMRWARILADLFGGVRNAGLLHRVCAVVTFGYLISHVVSLVRWKLKTRTPLREALFGERSLVFNWKDLQDLAGSFWWFLGRGPRPDYGRWTYWEKFDYMAVFWGVTIIGSTGLILWFPEAFTRFVPGWLINVAMIVHSDEALLAVGFIFTIHFFNTHLRPESFPLDPVIFTGVVPLEEYRKDRPAEYRWLRESGQLKKVVRQGGPSGRWLLAIKVFGFTLLATGLTLVSLIIYSMVLGYV